MEGSLIYNREDFNIKFLTRTDIASMSYREILAIFMVVDDNGYVNFDKLKKSFDETLDMDLREAIILGKEALREIKEKIRLLKT